MIPKIIHYCWFGQKKKNKRIMSCINSWKQHLPDYQFMEWNEENFDVDNKVYTQEAYNEKKYAFVSDVARLTALEKFGGIYLDTDVLVYKNFDEILKHKCVFGFEESNYVATSFMACEPHYYLIKEFLDYYEKLRYGEFQTNVIILTELLDGKGLARDNGYQILEKEIVIYPQEYFSPYDYINCVMKKTPNTVCAHLFFVSWGNKTEKLKRLIKSSLSKCINRNNMIRLRNMIKR